MDEKKQALILSAFDDARPHISEAKWLKTKINEIAETVETKQDLIKLLREEEERQTDPVKKTDIRVYLMQLEKQITKD
ncbi:MAG: hypothetical protein ACFFC5_01215 [Promethearchaeota archaeon]